MVDEPPGLTLAEVLTRLGPGLVTVAAGGQAMHRPIAGFAIHDPLQTLGSEEDQVLLAVGVDPSTPQAVSLVERAGGQGFVAVVLRCSVTLPEHLIESAVRHGVVLLVASPDVPWVHLAAMLHLGIGTGQGQELDGVALGDLFGFASALATYVGGPVTIEDPQSRVLAYSSIEGDVDEPRKETILGRQVPRKYTRLVQEKGVWRQLWSTDDVVYMDAVPEVGLGRRVAISIRVAGEMLGSIWVAEAGQPLAAACDAVLREAAKTATLHIVRHRIDLHNETTVRQDLIRELLDGRSAPNVVAVRLGIEPDRPYRVLAFETRGGKTPRPRLLHVVDMYCSTFRRAASTVEVGLRVYALLQHDDKQASTDVCSELRRFAAEGARRATDAIRAPVLAAIGSRVGSAAAIAESRREADRVMRVLLRGSTGHTVADLDDVRAHANLLELLDMLRERPHLQAGRLAELVSDGEERGAVLLETLRAYFDHFGDVSAAARAVQVHPNTFRYRLRRITELTGLRLADPTERLVTELQLRLLT